MRFVGDFSLVCLELIIGHSGYTTALLVASLYNWWLEYDTGRETEGYQSFEHIKLNSFINCTFSISISYSYQSDDIS